MGCVSGFSLLSLRYLGIRPMDYSGTTKNINLFSNRKINPDFFLSLQSKEQKRRQKNVIKPVQ